MIVNISNSDWSRLKVIRHATGRSKLDHNISYLLSEKIRAFDYKCNLKSKYNWFKKDESDPKYPFWRGLFACVNCNQEYSASIWTQDIDIQATIDLIGERRFQFCKAKNVKLQ